MGRPPPLSGLALGRCLAFKSPDLSSSSLRRLLRKKVFLSFRSFSSLRSWSVEIFFFSLFFLFSDITLPVHQF